MPTSAEYVLGTIRTVSSREIYRNRWLSLREDIVERSDGSQGIYSVVDRPDFVVVIAMEADGFHMVDQYRYPVSGRYWEFPQGSYPDNRPVDPEDLARHELAEETGMRASLLVPLGRLFGWHGASGQAFTVFLATDLTYGEPNREPEEQDMRQSWFSRVEFERMIEDGRVRDNCTLAAYTLLTLHERKVGPCGRAGNSSENQLNPVS